MRYRVNPIAVPRLITAWHTRVRPWGLAAAGRLRARPGGNVWDTLRGLEVPAQTQAWFAQARDERSRFVLPESVVLSAPVFPARAELTTDLGLDLETPDDLATLQETLSGAWQGHAEGHPSFDLAQELIAIDWLVPARAAAQDWPPGIHRLQHASLLFRGERGAVLTDPAYLAGGGPCAWNRPDALPRINAILLSHAHGDHFSLLSLMQFPRDTMIVVPVVTVPSLLSEDMAGQLRAAGFTRVVEAAWGTVLEIADLVVTVHPFYGEQPWTDAAEPVAGLRNAGNTYVVECCGKKTWLLVDSGPEHGQQVAELCARVRAAHGHIDFVMSNLREFHWFPGQIDGTGSFLMCFPIERLRDPAQWPYDQLITHGPRGIRDLLIALQPSYFLPYAHWFHPLERATHYFSDSGRTEQGLVDAIHDADRTASSGRLSTQLLRWQVGDHLAWSAPGVTVSSPMIDGA